MVARGVVAGRGVSAVAGDGVLRRCSVAASRMTVAVGAPVSFQARRARGQQLLAVIESFTARR